MLPQSYELERRLPHRIVGILNPSGDGGTEAEPAAQEDEVSRA
jgi:hypothetical protein